MADGDVVVGRDLQRLGNEPGTVGFEIREELEAKPGADLVEADALLGEEMNGVADAGLHVAEPAAVVVAELLRVGVEFPGVVFHFCDVFLQELGRALLVVERTLHCP